MKIAKTSWMNKMPGLVAVVGMSALVAPAQAADIVGTATQAGQFKTLLTAAKAAGLVGALQAKGPITVLAPSDAAFAKLPKGTVQSLLKDKQKLRQILTYHVISGKVPSSKVVTLKSAKTLNGKNVSIRTMHGKVMINKSTVVKPDIMASNGVIHVIDSVLMPPTM